ncbi:MAG: hypothetical protein MK137_07280 [Rickettsiales bacterium]|nr:hypothetical protein [Rickettsiales bacterium]
MEYKTKKQQNIAILTQETGYESGKTDGILRNRSIQLLIKEIEKQGHKVTLIPFLQYRINQNGSITGPEYRRSEGTNGFALYTDSKKDTTYNPSKYDIVLKRTWGPARTEGLRFYRHFNSHGAKVFNIPDSIALSHDKIAMGRYMERIGIPVPKTIEVSNPEELLSHYQIHKAALGRYVMVKGQVGTRGQGNRFVDTHATDAEQNIRKLQNYYNQTYNQGTGTKKGYALQKYIPTHKDLNKSNYIRVNMVDGRLQSAIEFTGEYDQSGQLVDGSRQDKPYFITPALRSALRPYQNHPEFKTGVWGIDVLKDRNTKKYHVLEINDGPNVSQVHAVSGKNLGVLQTIARQGCKRFPKAYASSLMNMVPEFMMNVINNALLFPASHH